MYTCIGHFTSAILSNMVSHSLGMTPFKLSSVSDPIIVKDLPDPSHTHKDNQKMEKGGNKGY